MTSRHSSISERVRSLLGLVDANEPDFSRVSKEITLSRFDHSLAEVVLDGLVVGHLACQVDAMSTGRRIGRFRRIWSNPTPFLHVLVTPADDVSPLPEDEDPWWFTLENARELRRLTEDALICPHRVTGQPVTYALRWLDSAETARLWGVAGHAFPATGVLVHR